MADDRAIAQQFVTTRHRITAIAHPDIPPGTRAMRTLSRLSDSGLLAVPAVALPGLHTKPKLETPSSTATATQDRLILGLSSPSPNCGMALARTCLDAEQATDENLDALFSQLSARLPLRRDSPALLGEELTDVLVRGAAAAIDRYGLDPSTLGFMDQRGNAMPSGQDCQPVLDALPRSARELGRWEFGLVGKGNHFLELQSIEEIHDPGVARAWNLRLGELVVMYHADSGHLGALTGRVYAHRQKNTRRGLVYTCRVKVPFQLTTGRWQRVLHRFLYHVAPRRWAPIPANSEEGRRTLLALQAASNYAYANRLAVLAALRDAIRIVWSDGHPDPGLLWDAPHNSIRREEVSGRELWVHRHNAARVEPPSQTPAGSPFAHTGHPVLLPGCDRTSSYLCVAGEGATTTLYSADHGGGEAALRFGRATGTPVATRLYGYREGFVGMRLHVSDDGIDKMLQVWRQHDIAQPVARLRPLAVLKVLD